MNNQDHVSTETLADHAEGLLGESGASRVDAHLEECAACRSTALLLASLRSILEADDPGPIPAHYAARIDATLAELAIAAPMLPGPRATAGRPAAAAGGGRGQEVIDLASRRTVVTGALRRLGTVAAGVVLLIGGAALGVQTLGGHGHSGRLGAVGAEPDVQPASLTFAAFPTAPPGSIDGPHGSKEGPDHWIYTKDKVFLPGGEVVLRPETPGASPVVIRPAHKPAAAPSAKAGKELAPPNTVAAPAIVAGATTPPAADPAATAAPTATAAPPPPPAAGQSKPAAAPGGEAIQIANRDPYVSRSGTAYTEDNFAAKVMDLLLDAQADQRPSTNGGARSSSTAKDIAVSPQDDPAAPPVEPQVVPTTPTRGPAPAQVKARLLRCATEIPGQAIAGDEGTWLDRPATIVVVRSDRADQVVGYVFYGDCAKQGPAIASDYQWKQQVDNPTAVPTRRSTSPARRVGEISGSTRAQRNTLPAGAAAPAPSPSTAAAIPAPR